MKNMDAQDAKPGELVKHMRRDAEGFIVATDPERGVYLVAIHGKSGWCKPCDLHPSSVLHRIHIERATYEAFARNVTET